MSVIILFGAIFITIFYCDCFYPRRFGPLALSLATDFSSEWWGQLATGGAGRLEIETGLISQMV